MQPSQLHDPFTDFAKKFSILLYCDQNPVQQVSVPPLQYLLVQISKNFHRKCYYYSIFPVTFFRQWLSTCFSGRRIRMRLQHSTPWVGCHSLHSLCSSPPSPSATVPSPGSWCVSDCNGINSREANTNQYQNCITALLHAFLAKAYFGLKTVFCGFHKYIGYLIFFLWEKSKWI